MEFGVPAPLMVAVLPESILALVIFHQNSTVCFFTIPLYTDVALATTTSSS